MYTKLNPFTFIHISGIYFLFVNSEYIPETLNSNFLFIQWLAFLDYEVKIILSEFLNIKYFLKSSHVFAKMKMEYEIKNIYIYWSNCSLHQKFILN